MSLGPSGQSSLPAGRTVWLSLTARDALLVRDGRPLDAGEAEVAEPVFPSPSTVGGAVYAAYGGAGGPEPAEIRGPVVAVHDGVEWSLCFPVPGDLVQASDDPGWVLRLAPKDCPDVTTDLPDAPAVLLDGHGEPVRGWVSGATLRDYLHGELVGPDGAEVTVLNRVFAADDPRVRVAPMVRETRLGLARTMGRTAAQGLLYQATFLRPYDDVALLAQVVLPAGWQRTLRGPVPLGGQARLADVATAVGVDWPQPPTAFPGGRVLVYVATPALWADGWRIPLPEGATLTAAAVGAAEPIATSSPRRGRMATRMLRWAVPAGSVYLLTFDSEQRAASWAAGVHGTAYLGEGARPQDERLRTAGFGVILTGVWA